MGPKYAIRADWGLFVAATWAPLLATGLIALTTGANIVPFVGLAITAIPIYFLAANAIIGRCVAQAADGSQSDQAPSSSTGGNAAESPGRPATLAPAVALRDSEADASLLRRAG